MNVVYYVLVAMIVSLSACVFYRRLNEIERAKDILRKARIQRPGA